MSSGNLIRATLAEVWNGGRWTVTPTPNPPIAGAAGLETVSCTGLTICMATGSYIDQTGEYGYTLSEEWNGSTWTRLPIKSPGAFADELHGVSCSGPSSCMAVGDFIGIGDEFTLANAWNGSAWTRVKAPQP